MHQVVRVTANKRKRRRWHMTAANKPLQECSICFDTISGEQGVIDSCEHIFCAACIGTWAASSNSCPVCRKRFSKILQPQAKQQQQRVPLRNITKHINVPHRDFVADDDDEDVSVQIRGNTILRLVYSDGESEYTDESDADESGNLQNFVVANQEVQFTGGAHDSDDDEEDEDLFHFSQGNTDDDTTATITADLTSKQRKLRRLEQLQPVPFDDEDFKLSQNTATTHASSQEQQHNKSVVEILQQQQAVTTKDVSPISIHSTPASSRKRKPVNSLRASSKKRLRRLVIDDDDEEENKDNNNGYASDKTEVLHPSRIPQVIRMLRFEL